MLGASLLISLACGAAAAPVASNAATTFTTTDASQPGTFIWISKVAPSVFGDDASAYDYYLHSDATAAKEAVQAYAEAVAAKEHESKILNSFLNATLAGTMSAEQAADDAWKCLELPNSISSAVLTCEGVAAEEVKEESSIGRRSLYRWALSSAHKSSKFAMNTLSGVLGSAIYNNLPESPRSFCNTASDGTNACFSWSRVEQSFNEGYAKGFVDDALSTVDFNSFSAQANGVVKKRQAAADACLSNRPSGCT